MSRLHDTHRRPRRAAVLAVAAVLGSAGVARAQASTNDSPRVDYEAPAECPAASDFNRRLAARTSSLGPHRGVEGMPTLFVRVTRGGRGSQAHGELTVRYADGTEATRVVRGDACESVVDALALMAAMALDPATLDATMPASQPPPAPPLAEPDQAATSALDRQPGAHVAVGAGGGATFGMAPVASPDASAFLELSGGGTSAWSPSVRAGFDYANSGSTNVAGGGIKLVRSIGSLDGCPLHWSPGAFRLLPCAHIEGGALSAAGLDVQPGRTALRPWVAAGAVGRVRYVTTARLFVEISGGLLAPLVRDRFFFEPNSSTTVFRAAPVLGFAGGALGFTIR